MSDTSLTPPLDQLPPPRAIHERMGRLMRELSLLRRLLRLSQAARDTVRDDGRGQRKAVQRAG